MPRSDGSARPPYPASGNATGRVLARRLDDEAILVPLTDEEMKNLDAFVDENFHTLNCFCGKCNPELYQTNHLSPEENAEMAEEDRVAGLHYHTEVHRKPLEGAA